MVRRSSSMSAVSSHNRLWQHAFSNKFLSLIALTTLAVAAFQAAPVHAQTIYVTSQEYYSVNQWTPDGGGHTIAYGPSTGGPLYSVSAALGYYNVFYTAYGNFTPGEGSISSYDTDTGTNVSPWFSNVDEPYGVAVSGDYLYYTSPYDGTVSQVDLATDTLVNQNFETGIKSAYGMTISGNDIFVVQGSGTIDEYTTSGNVVSTNLISGLGGAYNVAVSGDDLFVQDFFNNTVAEYTTGGSLINANFITNLDGPYGLAAFNGDLYITNYYSGQIAEYTTGGTLVNGDLFDVSEPLGISVIPEPSSRVLLVLGITPLIVRRRFSVSRATPVYPS